MFRLLLGFFLTICNSKSKPCVCTFVGMGLRYTWLNNGEVGKEFYR